MPDYIIVINGKPEGPYPLEKLKELGVRSETFVKTSGMDDYKEAGEIAELRALLKLKHKTVAPQYFATLDIRLLAVIIDYFIVFAFICILAFIAVLFIQSTEAKTVAAFSALAIIPFVKLIYSAFMEASIRQATFGKVLMGMKVTDEAGNPISSAQAFGRNFAKLICILTLGIGFLMGFFDKRQQCLHDKMAGTLVVKGRLI